MKQQTKKNVLSDIRTMHEFSYKVPAETRDEFWENKCINYPTASTCKVYAVEKVKNYKF